MASRVTSSRLKGAALDREAIRGNREDVDKARPLHAQIISPKPTCGASIIIDNQGL